MRFLCKNKDVPRKDVALSWSYLARDPLGPAGIK